MSTQSWTSLLATLLVLAPVPVLTWAGIWISLRMGWIHEYRRERWCRRCLGRPDKSSQQVRR